MRRGTRPAPYSNFAETGGNDTRDRRKVHILWMTRVLGLLRVPHEETGYHVLRLLALMPCSCKGGAGAGRRGSRSAVEPFSPGRRRCPGAGPALRFARL